MIHRVLKPANVKVRYPQTESWKLDCHPLGRVMKSTSIDKTSGAGTPFCSQALFAGSNELHLLGPLWPGTVEEVSMEPKTRSEASIQGTDPVGIPGGDLKSLQSQQLGKSERDVHQGRLRTAHQYEKWAVGAGAGVRRTAKRAVGAEDHLLRF